MSLTLAAPFRRFIRTEDGSATVEALLWLPVYTMMLVLVLDATFIFKGEGRVHSVVQDGARQYLQGFYVGSTDPKGDLEDWIEGKLASSGLTPNASASVSVDDDILTATVTYPSSDTDLSGVTGLLAGLTMRVTSRYLTEY